MPWAPPEVLRNESLDAAPPDVRGDVYSLAATVWHLLSGRSPFERPGDDNSADALRDRILIGEPTPMGRPDVPAALDRLLRHAMAPNPALRPSSALAFARGLQRVEQELRLALTQIVVPSGARLAEATTASSTRIRASIPRPSMPDPSMPDPSTPPRYAEWPARGDDWSVPVLSRAPSTRPHSPARLWDAHRVEVLVAAAILLVAIVVALLLLLR